MPKDEFAFDDPLELNGVALLTDEDTTEAMTECFIEEFMRLGYNPKQLLALFCNPHYLGMNMVLRNRGEPFVRDKITEIFARWRRPISSQDSGSSQREEGAAGILPADQSEESTAGKMPTAPWRCRLTDRRLKLLISLATEAQNLSLLTSAATQGTPDTATDPLGNPPPKPNP